MEELLKEIQKEAESNKLGLPETYQSLKAMGIQMFMTNTMSRQQVVGFCGGMIKLYQALKPKE